MASWQIWALASAGFAALTAVLAKVGVEHVSPDVATLIRTVVILAALVTLVAATRQFPALAEHFGTQLPVPCAVGTGHGGLVVVLLPGAAGGRCRPRRPARQAERGPCRAVRGRLSRREAGPGQLAGHRADGRRGLVRDLAGLKTKKGLQRAFKRCRPLGSTVAISGRYGLPGHPCGRPRRPAPGAARSCASHPARSGRPCDLPPRQECGPGRSWLRPRYALAALAPRLRSQAAVLREAALLIRHRLSPHARDAPLAFSVHRGKATVGRAPLIDSSLCHLLLSFNR